MVKSKLSMNAGMIVTFFLLLFPVLYAQETGILPLEFRKIPINGNDLVGDPEAVTVNYGFTTRTGSKIVEHGDSVTLLDSYEGLPTPHTKWVVPYARGPVRVLFVTNQAYGGRNPLELRQRSNFQISILHIPGVLNDARPDRQPVVHDFFWTKFQKLLDAECDVVFLATGDLEGGYKDFDNVKDRILRRIKEKVAAGCGLVLLHGNPRWYRLSKSRLAWLNELSPLKHGHSGITDRPARTQVRSAVSDSFSFASWPHATTNQVTADAGADVLATLSGRPFIATGRYGKGRVAAAYFQVQRINSGILPLFDPEKVTQLGDTHEPVYAFYLKALAWAAGREPLAGLSVPELTRSKAGESPKVVVRADLAAKALAKGGFALRYELRDPWGNRIRQVPNSVEMSPPGGQVTIPLVRLHANGLYRLDLWLLRDSKVENWGYTAIQVEGETRLGR